MAAAWNGLEQDGSSHGEARPGGTAKWPNHLAGLESVATHSEFNVHLVLLRFKSPIGLPPSRRPLRPRCLSGKTGPNIAEKPESRGCQVTASRTSGAEASAATGSRIAGSTNGPGFPCPTAGHNADLDCLRRPEVSGFRAARASITACTGFTATRSRTVPPSRCSPPAIAAVPMVIAATREASGRPRLVRSGSSVGSGLSGPARGRRYRAAQKAAQPAFWPALSAALFSLAHRTPRLKLKLPFPTPFPPCARSYGQPC